MATTIGFSKVQAYLTGFANLGAIGGSPHKKFWLFKPDGHTPITYNDFVNGVVPGVKYKGSDIPIIWKEFPILSPLYLILAESGFANKPQMIPDGDKLTDPGITITLPDGSSVSGAQILTDLEIWLKNGFPKDPVAIP